MGNLFGTSNVPQSKKPKGPEPRTMEGFNISKYLGTWYEVVHTAGADGSHCNNAIASYIKTSVPGEFQVVNSCYVNGERESLITGVVKMPDPMSTARLLIKFDTLGGKWFDYWIYWTDYVSYALVGSSSGHFWVLCRESQIELCILQAILRMVDRLRLGKGKEIVHDLNSLKECDSLGRELAKKIDAVYAQ